MKRGLTVGAVLVLCLFATACERGPTRATGPGPAAISVSYVDGAAPAVAVDAAHAHVLHLAELIGPDGTRLASGTVERVAPTAGSSGSPVGVGVGVFGGSGSGVGTGIGLNFPLGGAPNPPPASLPRSRARIPIADPVAYASTWSRSVIRLRFGAEPGAVTTADIPAPEPAKR